MKKKILVAIITTVLLFTNYISCNASSLPSPSNYIQPSVSSDSTEDPNMGQEQFNKINEGTTTYIEDSPKDISGKTSENLIATILAGIFIPIPSCINALLSIAVQPDVPMQKLVYFTIESLLSGKYDLLDINFFDFSESDSNINRITKENVAKWFFALRNFAIVALLAVLIYIGILMAISATSNDKARYKKMLINWLVSFILIFVIQYVLIIAINISNEFVKIITSVAESIENTTDATNVEGEQKDEIELKLVFGYIKEDETGKVERVPGFLSEFGTNSGWTRLALAVVYCVLVYYQLKFFFMYVKRFFVIGFLTAISPLITITYSIDKAKDNQAQAYKTWFKEIMVSIFIQPVHLLFFLIFMRSTQEIIFRAPIFAIVLIGALSRAETMVKKLFKVNRNSFGSLKRGGK